MKFFDRIHSELVLVTILFLFFLQLISDFVETTYSLCLITTSLNANVLSLFFIFSPIVLIFFKKGLPNKSMIIIGELMILCRIVEPMLVTQSKMIVSGLGVGFFLIFLPTFLFQKNQRNEDWVSSLKQDNRDNRPTGDENVEQNGLTLGLGLSIALALSILFRTLGTTVDLSTHSWFQFIGWILAAIATIMIVFVDGIRPLPKAGQSGRSPYQRRRQTAQADNEPKDNKKLALHNLANCATLHTSTWKISCLTLGLMGILVLIYFVFSSPTVISRWTAEDYTVITIILISAISLFTVIVTFRPEIIDVMKLQIISVLNGLFVFTLVLTIVLHQALIPSSQFVDTVTSALQRILPFLMLILSPVIFIDFILLSKELINSKLTARQIGVSFTLSSLYLLLIIFAKIFTITYDYIPGIGPLFRDMFWLVFLICGLAAVLPVRLVNISSLDATKPLKYLIAGLMLFIDLFWLMFLICGLVIALPVLLVNRNSLRFKKPFNELIPKIKIAGISAFVCAGVIVGVFITAPNPEAQMETPTTLTILTYNILAGKNVSGVKNFDGQLKKIKGINADIIGLQESDTARISGGNSDLVRYFADKLNLYSYYGPKTVTGTFGIALLSKYPIENANTFFMHSKGQQTACIEAQITVGTNQTFDVFVTHLGNSEDPSQIFQQKAILSRVAEKKNVILMGDFNFRSNTKQYEITTDRLNDSWQINSPKKVDETRIDHIFISPGIEVIDSKYLRSDDSDHPALKTDVSISDL